MIRVTGRRCLILAFLTLAPSSAARAQDDAAWQRDCEREDSDGERYCEVRHAGFRPTGSTLDLEPDGNGGVEIIGWDRDSVAIALRIQARARTDSDARDLAGEVQLALSGSSVRVRGPSTGRRESWSASLVLRVPRKTDLRATTTNGPLMVSDLNGAIDLRTANGPVSLSRLAGDVRARTRNGPLSVELDGAVWEGRGLDAESVNGPVELGIPDGYNAELETGTVNGPMTTRIPLTITVKGRVRDRIRTTLGKGGPPVRAVTTNGPITIHRASP